MGVERFGGAGEGEGEKGQVSSRLTQMLYRWGAVLPRSSWCFGLESKRALVEGRNAMKSKFAGEVRGNKRDAEDLILPFDTGGLFFR